VKISSCGEQSVSSDEEADVYDNSSMQHGIWAKSGAERPRFPFSGKPGINVDLEDRVNPLEYFELFCIPEIAEVIARETNRYAQKCSENTPNLKLGSRNHHWKETNRNEIMKFLAIFLLQGLNRITRATFPGGKFRKHPCSWTCSVRGFTFDLSFFILLTTKRVSVVKQGTTVKTVRWPCVLHRFFQRYHMAADF
jgi:hypothetical protein